MINFRQMPEQPRRYMMFMSKFLLTGIVVNEPTMEELRIGYGIDYEAERLNAAHEQLCEHFNLDPIDAQSWKREIISAWKDKK